MTELSKLLLRKLANPAAIRIRVLGSSEGPWAFSEYYFVSRRGLTRHSLEQQPRVSPRTCQASDSQIALFTRRNLMRVLASRHSFENTHLETGSEEIIEDDLTALTLAKGALDPFTLDRARASLSISSCVGCHATETIVDRDHTAPFEQVKLRSPGNPAASRIF